MPPKRGTRKPSARGQTRSKRATGSGFFDDLLDGVGRVASTVGQVGQAAAPFLPLLALGAHIHRIEHHLGLPHHIPNVDVHGGGILSGLLSDLGLGDHINGSSYDVAGDYDVGGDYSVGGSYHVGGSAPIQYQPLQTQALEDMQGRPAYRNGRGMSVQERMIFS